MMTAFSLRQVGHGRAARRARDEEGSSLVEFALTILVVVGLMFGMMELCLAFYTYQVINEYARAGARYAMVHGSSCVLPGGASCQQGTGSTPSVQTYLQNYSFPGITASNVTATPTYYLPLGTTACTTAACTGTGGQVTVTVTYPYTLSIPFIPAKAFTMSSSSTMIISQ